MKELSLFNYLLRENKNKLTIKEYHRREEEIKSLYNKGKITNEQYRKLLRKSYDTYNDSFDHALYYDCYFLLTPAYTTIVLHRETPCEEQYLNILTSYESSIKPIYKRGDIVRYKEDAGNNRYRFIGLVATELSSIGCMLEIIDVGYLMIRPVTDIIHNLELVERNDK